jgi:GT2 family glycosyltransferase
VAEPPSLLFSVIVPVYRQWPLLAKLCAALQAQTLPAAEFEVIIVNNDPNESGTELGVAPPVLDLPPHMRLLQCSVPGSYAARNQGAAQARGEWLVFTDADCLPGPDWLCALATAVPTAPHTLLAGPVRMITPDRPNAYATYDLLRGIPQERYVRHGYAATANLAVPRAVFAQVGGFDPERLSGGDAAFCRKAILAGHTIRLVPQAWIGHPCRSDWPSLAVKARRVKGGQLRGGQLRTRALWLLRSLTPPLRQMVRLVRAPAAWDERARAMVIALRLWGVELAEIYRLLMGGAPERR